jgi:hypothetical protein
MTLDEMLARESIRQTMAAYTMAGDRLRTEEFVAAFTEDGILETEGVAQEDLFRYQGREALRAWMDRWKIPAGAAPVHQSSFIRHHLATCQIELTGPETAKTRTYWTAYTSLGPDHCGVYVDDFRKVGDRWLIAHRRIREDWRRPDSLYNQSVSKTAIEGGR